MDLKFLKLIIHSEEPPVGLTGLCAGYELLEWRSSQFATWLLEEHLLDFALKYSDYSLISYSDAPRKLREAANIVFQSDNLNRGEFGELLLHGILKETYSTIPAVSKIYFKDGPNETVKGFDAVHVIPDGDNLELWLGEVKFYKDFKAASRDVVPEIHDHTKRDYLRNEFASITNKIDPGFPHADRLKKLLDPNTSLDEVFSAICIPVLITYDSETVNKFDVANDEYLAELSEEITKNHKYFVDLFGSCPLKVHLFIVPLEEKKDLSEKCLNKLQQWQTP